MPNGKFRLCFFKGEKFVAYHRGTDMDTKEEAERRKRNYERTYGIYPLVGLSEAPSIEGFRRGHYNHLYPDGVYPTTGQARADPRCLDFPDRRDRPPIGTRKMSARWIRKRDKHRAKEIRMDLFIVYKVNERQILDPSIKSYIGDPPADAYMTMYAPECVGCFHADTSDAACVKGAKMTQQFGNYIAIKVEPMSIDLSASPVKSIEATTEDDDDKEIPF